MTDFAIGGRVRIARDRGAYRSGAIGTVTEIVGGRYPYCVLFDDEPPGLLQPYRADELEKLDGEMDLPERTNAAGGPGMAGQETDHALDRDSGQHPAGQDPPAVAPVAVATVEALSKRVAKLELLMHVQDEFNHNLLALFTVHEPVHHTDDDND